MKLVFGFVFAILLLAQGEAYRPQYHFSPEKNWTNDPNGLVYFEGEYHLFFQYNPFGDKWGHMSWGHAVSMDLVHWQQLPVALPEENGIMIFTGSTVVDTRNSSGFCENSKPCLVAVYTGHTPEHGGQKALQTQNIAYSNDRGRTWTKYKGNPVLDLHMPDFRDPKVLWSEASHAWVMVVALPDDHKVQIYNSPDLKHWAHVSDFGPAGAASGQWECPELFELPVEGGGTRWVLKVGLNPGALQGGSGEQYFIGKFDGKHFTNDNPASQTMWTDYGKDCYCALTFSNLPKTKPMVMIGWMSNWQYAADLPTAPFRGQMTVPRKLSLRQTPDGLRLFQQPIDAVTALRSTSASSTVSSPFDLEATVDTASAPVTGVRLVSADGSATVIGYDKASRNLFVDRTRSGKVNFNTKFPVKVQAPLPLAGSTLKLRVLGDTNSVEVFADNGRVTMTNLVFAPAGAQKVELLGKGTVNTWTLKVP